MQRSYVRKTFRSSLYKRKTFLHAYKYVLFGKTDVMSAVNTKLYQMLEGNKILILFYFILFFDLVIVFVAFLTQWDFFHHDKATKFLFLEGSLGSDILRRGSLKWLCWGFMQL